MEGDSRVYALIDTGIEHEIAVAAMYMLDHVIQKVLGYSKLADQTESRAREEMHHAEELMHRAVFLNYKPKVDKMDPFDVASSPAEQVIAEREQEAAIIQIYNDAIATCFECGDHGTRALFEHILADEERHLEDLERQIAQIEQIGESNWPAAQVSDGSDKPTVY